jgi:chromate transporter
MHGAPLQIALDWSDWLDLFSHYLMLSLMSVGGAISTTAEMHRYLVEQHHWLTQAQFNESIALAQAAPGPNVLFVALMGWNVGLNAGSMAAALLGVATTMLGILLPSTALTYVAAQWGHRNRHLRAVRAFKQGMAPLVIALLLSTSLILGAAGGVAQRDWPLWLLALVSGLVIWRTKLHLLWVLAAGALLGALQLL